MNPKPVLEMTSCVHPFPAWVRVRFPLDPERWSATCEVCGADLTVRTAT